LGSPLAHAAKPDTVSRRPAARTLNQNSMKLIRSALTLFCVAALSSGAFADDAKISPAATAVAHLQPAANSKVTGTVQFIPVSEGVRVVAEIKNLTPGEHGFHVHEKGDLSAPDLSSAGGHFNPTKLQHGGREAEMRHAGDMGNLKADASGVAHLDYVDKHMSLGGPDSVVGRAVIIHEKADDMKSQPAGNSGARIAGGVIEKVSGAK
jgi:superoxide dismutase, Cu-Zn family